MERARSARLGHLSQEALDVDAAMRRRERRQPAFRLLELPLEPGAVPAAGLVPGDDDVDEALKKVPFGRLCGAPSILERLVRGEVLALPREVEAARQISRDRP